MSRVYGVNRCGGLLDVLKPVVVCFKMILSVKAYQQTIRDRQVKLKLNLCKDAQYDKVCSAVEKANTYLRNYIEWTASAERDDVSSLTRDGDGRSVCPLFHSLLL